MTLPNKLPKPDERGHYWLEKRGGPGAVIFEAHGSGAPAEHYVASLGGDIGFLFDGPVMRYYSTPEDALADLIRADKAIQRQQLKGAR